ncbi:HNH endonuclease [Paraconexibacter antarcticus]|uniref:HNH endonuclease n=1 Tax=Paraconexibacter antarcticus TaxID=2949664 RepID=A0ABY5DVU0_9ACTN|nr:HNH endonuclease [Paraconexibacter antarcticus]UTI65605.1 HNH endonuclease [Paraconexibacter antarcticus]
MALLPLRARDGTVRAYARFDVDDLRLVRGRPWHLAAVGYPRSSQDYLHRVVMGLEAGDRRSVDHINGDKLDNRRCNLRVVTHAENQQNRREGYGISSHRGVSWDATRGKWTARVKLAGKVHYLGRFEDEQKAADAAARFRAEHMPFSADAMAEKV